MYPSRAKCTVNVIYNDGGGSPCYLNIIIPSPMMMSLHKKVKVYQTLDNLLREMLTYKIAPFQTPCYICRTPAIYLC